MIHGILHGAHAGKNERIRIPDDGRVPRHDTVQTGPFRRAVCIRQISCLIVNNRSFHQSTPLDDRTPSPPRNDTASASA